MSLKRLLDVIGATVALVLLLPVIVLAAGAVATTIGRPVLFRQRRIGTGGRPFDLVKLRTMTDARGPDGVPLPDEDRQTRSGRALRALSIDELPSLWLVLRGDLSLVGPRPLLPQYLDRYTPRQARRHEVRPGLTGWAQVNGRNDAGWAEKLEMDVWYVEHRWLGLDLWILLRTVGVVLGRRGVTREGHATAPEFLGAPDPVRTDPDGRRAPLLIHLTTVDLSLVHLLLPQLRAFRDTGFEVVGVSAAGPSVPSLEAEGIRHVALRNATRASAPWRDAAALVEFWRLCRRLRPDVVHTHNPKPGVWGRIAARLAGVPRVVNTVHGLYATPEDPWSRRAVVYALERIASTCSDAELLQNEEDLPVLRRIGVPARKLTVMGNGVDLARFDPDAVGPDARTAARAAWGVGPATVVVGAVGRMVAEKGWRELFAAVATLRAEGRDVALVAIGPSDPDKRDAITAAELDAARADGAVLTGWRDGIERAYPGMDLLCLPSWREGFPRAAMEAAAMGLPIVATDVRGCRQVLADGETGVLVPARDVPALTDALRDLAGDPDLRRRYGRAAHTRAVHEFDVRRQVAASLEAYGAATGRARTAVTAGQRTTGGGA